jgi:hypothetical protein
MIYGTPNIITNGLLVNLDNISPKSTPIPQTINLIYPSEKFTGWTLSNLIVSGNTQTNPIDGSQNTDKIIGTIGSLGYLQSNTFSVISGQTYSFSVYARAAEFNLTTIQLSPNFGTGPNRYAVFNLTGGTIPNSNTTTTFNNVGGGWYRVGITANATATASTSRANIFTYSIVTNQPIGNSTSGLYIFGSQVESGGIKPYQQSTNNQGLRNIWFDTSGNGNDMTLTGITYNTNFGNYQFNGINDYMYIPNKPIINFSGTPFTYEMMVKLPSSLPPTNKYLLTKGTSGFTAYFNNNLLYIGKDLVIDWDSVSVSNFLNQNLHIIVGWDGVNRFCYLNGVQSLFSPQTTNLIDTTTSPLYVGGKPGTTSFYDGSLYFFRLYNRGLTQTEINQNFNAIRARYNL